MKNQCQLYFSGYTQGIGVHTGAFPQHAHGCAELVYVLKGHCRTDADDLPALDCPAGTLLITPPGVRHYQTDTPECDTLYIGFCRGNIIFDCSWRKIFLPDDEDLTAYLFVLLRKFCRREIDAESSAVVAALLEHIKNREESIDRKKFMHPALKRALEYISENIASSFDLQCVADHAGCSVPNLNKLFNSHCECSPGRYITGKKLELAKLLLADPLYSVSEIAERAGFADSNYFIRIFRKKFGVTPGRFRKNIKYSD